MTVEEYANLPIRDCNDCKYKLDFKEGSWVCTKLFASNNDMRCTDFRPKEGQGD